MSKFTTATSKKNGARADEYCVAKHTVKFPESYFPVVGEVMSKGRTKVACPGTREGTPRLGDEVARTK
ncbi:hypothetical protein J6590_057613 [Homalodisca vitripennis]|nr:hypothetical protein J6590_057613 [Homalodisca vitripennis]